MSELPNRVPKIQRERSLSLAGRLGYVFGFVFAVVLTVAFTPQIAKQIAYSWNIGVERAKVETARQFLADNPQSEQRIALVAKAVAPSAVGIQVISSRPQEGYNTLRENSAILEAGAGSGVIVDAEEGYVLTNFHVIANAHIILVRLNDGREIEAEVVGRNRDVDLAVLRIDSDDLVAISWGDSREVAVGEQVLAFGSPYGYQQTVTAGIISATERYNEMLVTQRRGRGRPIPQELLQTDAAINPGNSGGALVNMNGKLIGICTAIISADSGGNSGINFVIPSFTAKQIYEEIVSHGETKHGWIGIGRLENVTSYEARLMNQKKPMGTIVRSFGRRASPARNAGLQERDIILRWGETEIANSLHLIHLVTLTQPGTKETVEVFRDGEILTFEITVGVRPNDL
jgi:S1-C subfamily serine protease